MRILLAEDEQELNQVIVKTLERNGYSVDSCTDGAEALYYLENTEYDAAILDIMMPKMSGIEVLKCLRTKKSSLPVLFLTARDSISQRVEGLDAGADDYLVKPFAFDELLARLRVLLRKKSGHSQNYLTLADLTLNLSSRTVSRDNTPILLSAKEFALLEYMMLNQGIVLGREQIESHIWNYDYEGGSNLVDVYIRYLRKKIDDPFQRKLIHTVRGVGYILKE